MACLLLFAKRCSLVDAESTHRTMTVAKPSPSAESSFPDIRFVLGSLGAGGAERVAVTMGRRPPAGHEVGMSLLCDLREYAWPGPAESLGVEVYSSQASPQRKLGSLIGGVRRLRSRLRRERPKACVGFTTWPNLLGLAACPRDVRSVITCAHSRERGRSGSVSGASSRNHTAGLSASRWNHRGIGGHRAASNDISGLLASRCASCLTPLTWRISSSSQRTPLPLERQTCRPARTCSMLADTRSRRDLTRCSESTPSFADRCQSRLNWYW